MSETSVDTELTPASTFIEEAEKLERRARAYRIIAYMISKESLTLEEKADLWALRCYIG